MSASRSRQRGLCLSLLLVTAPSTAAAAGFFLAPRGVRPLARGGAFVAGADDANALSYNPAGIGEASTGVWLDMAMSRHASSYTRSLTAEDDSYGPVKGREMGLPSPTLGGVVAIPWVAGLSMGVGLAADYPLLQNWPLEKDRGEPAGQRYAIGDYSGTKIFKTSLAAAYHLGEYVTVGAALQMFLGNFTTQVTVSTCDGFICTQPENPAYDALVQVNADNLAIPGAHLGFLIKIDPWVRFGAAWETGYRINQPASLAIRMPSAAMYDGSDLNPDNPTGRIRMRLPQQARVGLEGRWGSLLRGEIAAVWEQWSVHDRIDIDTSGVTMSNVLGLGDYSLSNMSIERGFSDVWSVRIGSELHPPIGLERPLAVRFGAMLEPSAIPNKNLTAMTVDLDKLVLGLGAAYAWWRLEFEATYAHVFMQSTTVRNSEVKQTNPTRPDWGRTTAIGNGTYESSADLFGLGIKVFL